MQAFNPKDKGDKNGQGPEFPWNVPNTASRSTGTIMARLFGEYQDLVNGINVKKEKGEIDEPLRQKALALAREKFDPRFQAARELLISKEMSLK